MKDWISEIMIISGDKDGDDGHAESQQDFGKRRQAELECCEKQDAGGVDHGELVKKLHGILECTVEDEGAHADHQI
jgi:hypothetical protein